MKRIFRLILLLNMRKILIDNAFCQPLGNNAVFFIFIETQTNKKNLVKINIITIKQIGE